MMRLSALLLSISISSLAAAPDVPAQPPKKPVDAGAEGGKEAAPRPQDKHAGNEEMDVQKTAERIAENAEKAGARLKEKDPGEDTRKIQLEVLKDIDALIKKSQPPPPPKSDMNPMPPMMPPPKSDMAPPMGGGTGNNQPKTPMPMGGNTGGSPQPKMGKGGTGGSASKPGRRPRRERRPRGDSPRNMGDPMPRPETGPGSSPMPATLEPKEKGKDDPQERGRFGMPSPRRTSESLADLYKDLWGQLPDRLRQEMDLYYRDRFMPRYSELLRQYYAALAEQKKSGTENR